MTRAPQSANGEKGDYEQWRELAMTRRDNASNHLTKLIASARRLKRKGWKGHMTLALLGDRDAHQLIVSTEVERNFSLQSAFKDFGLDPRDADHWRLLAALLAEAYYVARRSRGGKKRWDARQLCQLLADFAAVKKNTRKFGTTGKYAFW
jgi:hypothetical protein